MTLHFQNMTWECRHEAWVLVTMASMVTWLTGNSWCPPAPICFLHLLESVHSEGATRPECRYYVHYTCAGFVVFKHVQEGLAYKILCLPWCKNLLFVQFHELRKRACAFIHHNYVWPHVLWCIHNTYILINQEATQEIYIILANTVVFWSWSLMHH